MIDGDVQKAIKSILDAGFIAQGLTVTVAQTYNPTTQGVPLVPVVFFTKILAVRFGAQGQKYEYNGGNDSFDKTESYYLKATYQINAVISQNISDPDSLNAYDVVDLAAAILQTAETRDTLRAAGIGIERITDIRTPNYLDDSDLYKIDPSFDFVLSYQNTIASTVNKAAVNGTVSAVP